MFLKLLMIFILVPFLELIIIIQLGKYIGLAWTILLIVILGLLGAFIAKKQGLSILWRIKDELGQGRLPGQELLDGGLLLLGSALLITPGLLTDALAFFFLLPATRRIMKSFIQYKLENWLASGKAIRFYFRRD